MTVAKLRDTCSGYSPWFLCRWMLLLTLVSVSGCGGCQQDQDKLTREELEKRAKEQRESLELSSLVSLPTDVEAKIFLAKPGHWHHTQQKFKSNRDDLQVVALGSVTRGTDAAHIPGTNVMNEFTRRTSLPKGQTKTVDLQYFIPFSGRKVDPLAQISNQLRLRTELLSWPLMTPILQAPSVMPAKELKEHEFQMVALGPEVLTYEYLTVLDAVYWRGDEFMLEDRTRSYYVTLVRPVDGKYAMPNSMLTMTSIAAIVWDDVSPDELSAVQQQALIDWVHWGGQLIVSGPSSWSRLKNSFLSPYLPAASADAAELTTADFGPLSEKWVVPDRASRSREQEPLEIIGAPIGGLRFRLQSGGNWLPGTGDLVAEAQVGRGRVVLTGFPLREPRVYRWKYFSSFLSTGLLRRHPREYRRSKSQDRSLAQFWTKPYAESHHDARMHSNLRILTRDLPLSDNVNDSLESLEVSGMGGATFELAQDNETSKPELQDTPQVSEAMLWGGRGAAWNDYSGLSFEALEALKAAAGIELPSRKTIIYLLAGYLACLVPLNWIVFRLIGRLEFAWIAAPIMALIGVAVVTKIARLDIGFARRNTEISVLEMYGGYNRAHLTQYLALYTSLSTNYSIEFPETDSAALPLGDISRNQLRAAAGIRNLRTNYGRAEGVTLEPLTVYSNSTEMLHAEQVLSLEGALILGSSDESGNGPPAIKNESGLEIRSALVLRRTRESGLELAWIGDLDSGQAATLNFQPATKEALAEKWDRQPVTQSQQPDMDVGAGTENESLWIGGVLHEIVIKTPLVDGQTRLFGYTNERPSQLTVVPKEDQFDGRCIVVVHLTPEQLGDVQPDKNIMSRTNSAKLDAESATKTGREDEQDADPDRDTSAIPVDGNENQP